MKRSTKRFWLVISTILILAVGVFAAVWIGLGFYLSPQSTLHKADAIIVISGGQTTTRAAHGIELYKAGWAPKLIFSGAALDDGPSNAAAMSEQAQADGVSPTFILTDDASQTTYQNALDTKQIVDANHWHTLILVTSPYHQRRADMTFEHVYGSNYTIINSSSVDDRWSKRYWYRSGFSFNVSMEELRKIIYIDLTHKYQ